VEQDQAAAGTDHPGQLGQAMGGVGKVGQEAGGEGAVDRGGGERQAAGVGQGEQGVGVAAVAAAGVQGDLPGMQADLGHRGRIGRVVVGEARLPGRRPRGEEGPGLGQEHLGAEAAGQRRAHAADHRPAGVVQVDHDVGGVLGVDLGEVVGRGRGPVGVVVRAGGPRRVRAQEHDQVPGAQELRVLEEAAVHQHQVVAGPGAVRGSFHPWAGRVQEAERIQGHRAAAAATAHQRQAQVAGQGPGRGVGQAVDGHMDRRGMVHGGHGIGERLHDLGAPGRLVGLDRRVHTDRPPAVWRGSQLRLEGRV